jgi:hypothetical protein
VPEPTPLRSHQDPGFFREALTFTAAQTGFASRRIEKDYFSLAGAGARGEARGS